MASKLFLCVAAVLFIVVKSAGRCHEQAAVASTCKDVGSKNTNNLLYSCILMQNGSCKGAINKLLAKKHVPACKDNAEHMQKAVDKCNTILRGCPEIKGLGVCLKGFIDHPKQKCAVMKLSKCDEGIYALLAKDKTSTNAGCRQLAQIFSNDMKICGEGHFVNLTHVSVGLLGVM